MVSNVTPVKLPERAERDILGMILDFFAISGRFCGRGGGTLWCRILLFIPNNFTQDHFLKIEWLVANWSPDRAQRDILHHKSRLIC